MPDYRSFSPYCLLAMLAVALAFFASAAPQGASAVAVTGSSLPRWDACEEEQQRCKLETELSKEHTNLLQTAVEFRVRAAAPNTTQSQDHAQNFKDSSGAQDWWTRKIYVKYGKGRVRKKHPIRERNQAVDDAWRPSNLFKNTKFLVPDIIFVIASLLFLRMHYVLVNKAPPEKDNNAAKVLAFWLIVATASGLAIYAFRDAEAGTDWMTGYLQELVFSLENIFAFLSIFRAFQTPRKLRTKVLGVTVFLQVIYQLFLYEDLARWLRSQAWLPALLGTWLCILGIISLEKDQHKDVREPTQNQSEIHEMLAVRFFHKLSGCLTVNYKGANFFYWDASGFHITLLGPVFLSILATDMFMEVDVTLTKIESIPNMFLSFTSSAIAAFAVPVLFFVAQDLFERFELLHYGICFVLVFFGVSLIFEEVVEISASVQILILLAALSLCVLCSEPQPAKKQDSDSDSIDPKSSEEEWTLAVEFIDCFGLRTWRSVGTDQTEEKLR